MSFLLAALWLDSAQAQTVVASGLLTDIPAGFSVPDRVFLDQDPARPGTQVRVDVVQGAGANTQRVVFRTGDARNTTTNRRTTVQIGRSIGTGDDGIIDHAFAFEGRVYAYGVDTRGGDVLWFPRFNTGTSKRVWILLPNGDADFDGLTTEDEAVLYGTDPKVVDTDGGQVGDGEEIRAGTDPLDRADDYQDSDGDRLADVEEIVLTRTDPFDSDTDNDGLLDGDELLSYGTNPRKSDSDNDGLGDGAEVQIWATDPRATDTDGGGVSDGDEVIAGTWPLDAADD
jgi:hypothetical protein